ncbi:hypothetical protein YC2023_042234 [Brassica napus]
MIISMQSSRKASQRGLEAANAKSKQKLFCIKAWIMCPIARQLPAVPGNMMKVSVKTSCGNHIFTYACHVSVLWAPLLKSVKKCQAHGLNPKNVSLCLSCSSNRRPGVRHSTFESLHLSRSSQSIASGFLCFWDSLNFKKDMEFVGITVHFLDEKVAMCSSMYKITDHPFLIRFISLTIIDEVITGALEINLQSKLDCSKSPFDCEHKPRTPRYIIILHLEKQTQPHPQIQETIPIDTKEATTSPPAHSSCLMKIAYMLNFKSFYIRPHIHMDKELSAFDSMVLKSEYCGCKDACTISFFDRSHM